MSRNSDQNSKNHVEETVAQSLGMSPRRDTPLRGLLGESVLPSLTRDDQMPVHLVSLSNRARSYIEAASSTNTRKASALIFRDGAKCLNAAGCGIPKFRDSDDLNALAKS